MALVLTFLAIIATATGAGMLVPQVARTRRHQTLDGVSVPWIGVGIAMNSWWLAYALQGRIFGLVPVSALGLLLYGYLAFAAVKLSSPRPIEAVGAMTRGALALGWIPLVALPIGGWSAAGLAIGLCYGAQFVPAAIEAWRAERLDGLSPATWVLALIEAVAWLAYGWLTADVALVVGGAGGSVMSSLILLRLVQSSRSSTARQRWMTDPAAMS